MSGTGHTKVMNTLHAIEFGREVVHKDRFVSKGAFCLNGHDSSNLSAKKAVLKIPPKGCIHTNRVEPPRLEWLSGTSAGGG
jgi:hypothetical protein